MADKKRTELVSAEIGTIEVTEELLREKLYEIRGVKVMLDADLAEIYGYTTKAFNQQIKNNLEKFDDDFMFELSDEEVEDLRSKNLTANLSSKSRYNPHVFTEQGLYMLMTVLRGELATKQSKALVRTFKKMKDYIIGSKGLIGQREVIQLSLQTIENTAEISKLRMDIGSVEKQMSDVMDQLNDVVTKSELNNTIEKFGSGFKRIDSLCKDAGVKYSYENGQNGFKFIIKRNPITSDTANVTSNVTTDVTSAEDLNLTEKTVLAILKAKPDASRDELAEKASKTVRTVQRTLNSLRDKGYIEREGAKQNTVWKVKK